jgi:hypothetical protein
MALTAITRSAFETIQTKAKQRIPAIPSGQCSAVAAGSAGNTKGIGRNDLHSGSTAKMSLPYGQAMLKIAMGGRDWRAGLCVASDDQQSGVSQVR